VLREAARWKERYEWVEKDRETKAKVLETKNTQLESEIKMLRVELESGKIQLTELQAELEESRMGNRRLAEDLEVRDGEIGRLEQRCAELEESLGSRVSRLEEEYVSKYKNLEKQRDTQIYNAIQNKEEEFRKEWKLLDQDWTVKIEEIHKSYEAKLALQIAAHNRTLD
jgi:chromosome segregation ATPase